MWLPGTRRSLNLCLAQDARHLGAAHGANALRETTTIGLLHVAREFALFLALHAVRLTGVALGHGALLSHLPRMRAVALATDAPRGLSPR
ncbi:MAG: hypothetical protein RJB01_807 [Actinomycetota bacterium]